MRSHLPITLGLAGLALSAALSANKYATRARAPPIALVSTADGGEPLVFNSLPVPLARVVLSEEGGSVQKLGMGVAMEQDACALLGAAGLDDGEQLSLTLCDDESIQQLNQEWRQIDKPTDVLSFPMDDDQLLGDLVISLDTAQKQAAERGHTLRDECRVRAAPPLKSRVSFTHTRTHTISPVSLLTTKTCMFVPPFSSSLSLSLSPDPHDPWLPAPDWV